MRYVLILKRSNLFSPNNHEMNVINEGKMNNLDLSSFMRILLRIFVDLSIESPPLANSR